VRQHAEALERLQRTSEAVHLVPIASNAPPLPAKEFDDATGQIAEEANAELFRQLQKSGRAARK